MSAHSVPSRFERSGSTVRFDHAGAPVTVTVCTSRIVRVELADERDVAGPSYVDPRSWADSPFEVLDGEPVRLSTPDLRVEAATSPLRLSFLDASGNWLLRETAWDGMFTESSGDARRRLHASFEFSGEQHFYGLGQGGREIDRLGVARQLWNTHIGHGPGSDMGVPLLVSHRGYALFFDNTSDAMLSVGRSDGGVRIAYTAEAGRLVWYFLIGRDLRGVMREVAELLGRPPLPPRWALGFLQSTRHFEDTEELRRLPRTIREKRIPCDGLIYLSTYGEAQGWNRGVGHLGFQPTLWPDPSALIDEARQRHFEIITHEYPVLHEQSPLFRRGRGQGISPRRGLWPGERDRGPERQLSRRSALPRLFQPGRRRLVVVGPPRAAHARGRGLVARRRRRSPGDGHAPRRRRHAASQYLRPLSPRGLRGRRGDRPARSARLSALSLRLGGDAAVRGDVLVGRYQQ